METLNLNRSFKSTPSKEANAPANLGLVSQSQQEVPLASLRGLPRHHQQKRRQRHVMGLRLIVGTAPKPTSELDGWKVCPLRHDSPEPSFSVVFFSSTPVGRHLQVISHCHVEK